MASPTPEEMTWCGSTLWFPSTTTEPFFPVVGAELIDDRAEFGTRQRTAQTQVASRPEPQLPVLRNVVAIDAVLAREVTRGDLPDAFEPLPMGHGSHVDTDRV